MSNNEALIVIVVAVFVVAVIKMMINHAESTQRMRIRAENIKHHGWPPRHLDADGDRQWETYDDNDVRLFREGIHPMQTGVRDTPSNTVAA